MTHREPMLGTSHGIAAIAAATPAVTWRNAGGGLSPDSRQKRLRETSGWFEPGIALFVVGTAHALLLWWMAATISRQPLDVAPPALVGILVPPPAVTGPRALPIEPVPQPRPTVIPKPTPRPRPVPVPVPAGPPAERAVSAPPSEPPAPAPVAQIAAASPSPVPAPAPTTPAAESLPVTPPRSDAAHLSNPAPAYPPLSRRMGEQGRVLFDVFILADGSVGEIRLKHSSGYPRLDRAAEEAVRRWRYQPARQGGEPIPYWYVQPVVFSLDR